jgi:hypothetical protein
MMKTIFVVLALVALGVFCYATLWLRWPPMPSEQTLAVFTFLQFSGTVILILVTLLYARAAWALVESQNRVPEICVSEPPILPNLPTSSDSEFSMDFEVIVVNPSIRAASVRVESVEINGTAARHATLVYDGKGMRRGVTVIGGGLVEAMVKATFTDLSVFPAKNLRVSFREIVSNKRINADVSW